MPLAAQITFNVNDAVAIVNSILAFVPKLASIAHFLILAVLVWRLWKDRLNLDTTELAAIAIAFALTK